MIIVIVLVSFAGGIIIGHKLGQETQYRPKIIIFPNGSMLIPDGVDFERATEDLMVKGAQDANSTTTT